MHEKLTLFRKKWGFRKEKQDFHTKKSVESSLANYTSNRAYSFNRPSFGVHSQKRSIHEPAHALLGKSSCEQSCTFFGAYIKYNTSNKSKIREPLTSIDRFFFAFTTMKKHGGKFFTSPAKQSLSENRICCLQKASRVFGLTYWNYEFTLIQIAGIKNVENAN